VRNVGNKRQSSRIRVPQVKISNNLKTSFNLENYDILCLFDVEFPYTKKIFETLSVNQVNMFRTKWPQAEEVDLIESFWDSSQLKPLVNRYTKVIKNHVDDYSFNVNFKALLTDLMKQKRENYNHPEDYETFWCHNFYIQMILQIIRKHSSIHDSTISEYQYRKEIVNILLASIFHDVETAIWIQTERLGDKHDGILYYNLNGIKVIVGYMEVVGNAFASNTSDKNSDLEKLLKAMMILLWYQDAHQQINAPKKLQSFAILVF
ncbi:32996_t:CDS:2, partial [Racocetra persica]